MCQKSKIFKDPQFLGSPKALGVASDLMFLEFNGRGGIYLCKNAKVPTPKLCFWQVPTHLCPDISGPTQKYKILLPRLFSPGLKVSKKVCHTPVGQKVREATDFLEKGSFWPWAIPLRPADPTPPPPTQKLPVWSWTSPENFFKIL